MNLEIVKVPSKSVRLFFILPEGERNPARYVGFLCQRLLPEYEFVFFSSPEQYNGDGVLKALDLRVYRTFTSFISDARNCHCRVRIRHRTTPLLGMSRFIHTRAGI